MTEWQKYKAQNGINTGAYEDEEEKKYKQELSRQRYQEYAKQRDQAAQQRSQNVQQNNQNIQQNNQQAIEAKNGLGSIGLFERKANAVVSNANANNQRINNANAIVQGNGVPESLKAANERLSNMNPEYRKMIEDYVASGVKGLKGLSALTRIQEKTKLSEDAIASAVDDIKAINEHTSDVNKVKNKVADAYAGVEDLDDKSFNLISNYVNKGGTLSDLTNIQKQTNLSEDRIAKAVDDIKKINKAEQKAENKGISWLSDTQQLDYYEGKINDTPADMKKAITNYGDAYTRFNAGMNVVGVKEDSEFRSQIEKEYGGLGGMKTSIVNQLAKDHPEYSKSQIKKLLDNQEQISNKNVSDINNSSVAIDTNGNKLLQGARNTGTYIANIPYKVGGGVANTVNTIANQVTGTPYNSYNMGNMASRLSSEASNQVVQNAIGSDHPLGQLLYQASLSTIDAAAIIAASGGTGLTGELAELVNLGTFSSVAFNDSMMEAKAKGLNDKDAFWVSLAKGSIEAITEKIPLDNLYGFVGNVDENFWPFLIKQVLSEGTEEAASDIMGRAAEYYLIGDTGLSEYDMDVKAIMDEAAQKHMPISEEEARERAESNFWKSTRDDFAAGAFSGGVLGFAGGAYNAGIAKSEQNRTSELYRQYSNDIKTESRYGKDTKNQYDTYANNSLRAYADKVDDSTSKGKEIRDKLNKLADKADNGKKLSIADQHKFRSLVNEAQSVESTDESRSFVGRIAKESALVPEEHRTAVTGITEQQARPQLVQAAKEGDVDKIDNIHKLLKNSTSAESRNNADSIVGDYKAMALGNGVSNESWDSIMVNTSEDAYMSGLYGEDINEAASGTVKAAYEAGILQAKENRAKNIENFAQYKSTVAAQNAYKANINKEVDVFQYDEAFDKFYNSGAAGLSYDQALENAGSYSVIGEKAAKAIYEAGVEDYIAGEAKIEAEAINRAMGVKEKGTGSFVDARANKTRDVNTNFMRLVAKVTGLDIQLVNANTSNVQASFTPSKSQIVVTEDHASQLVHELGEFVSYYASDEYEGVRLAAMGAARGILGAERFNNVLMNYQKAYKSISPEQTVFDSTNEMANDYLVALMNTENGQKALADYIAKNNTEEEAKKTGNKIVDMFKSIIKSLKNMIANTKLNTYQRRILASDIKGNEENIQMFMKALDKAIENYRNTKANPNAVDTGVRNSLSIEEHEGEEVSTVDGTTRFSVATYENGGRALLENYLKTSGLSESDQLDILDQLDWGYKVAQDMLKREELTSFGEWSKTELTVAPDGTPYLRMYNNDGRPIKSVVVNNGEYPLNIDFSQVCKKRVALNTVLNKLVADADLNLNVLTESDINDINALIKEKGFEIACGLCFVDSKRYKIGDWAYSFTDGKFDKNGKKTVGGWNDIIKSITPKGVNADYFNYASSIDVPVGTKLHELSDDQINWSKIDSTLKPYLKEDGSLGSKKNASGKTSNPTERIRMMYLIRNNPECRHLLNKDDIMASEGLDAIREKNYPLYKLLNAHWGAGKPKLSHGYTAYGNDILESSKWGNKNDFNPKNSWSVGGVRVQSFSDYVANMFFDYMQMFADMSARQLPSHAYTKEVDYVKIFGLTGQKINMSLVPRAAKLTEEQIERYNKLGGNGKRINVNKILKDPEFKALAEHAGLDENGNYIWEDETFPYDEAMKLRSQDGYKDNCGTIAVGVSNAHIRKLLSDPNIDMVIPYHSSGVSQLIKKARNIALYTDYQSVQNTLNENGKAMKNDGFDWYGLLKSENNPNGLEAKEVAQKYLDYCKENGYTPKFSEFANEENYYKLLIDFRAYDENGNFQQQNAVKAQYPSNLKELVQKSLKAQQVTEDKMNVEMSDEQNSLYTEVKNILRDRGTLYSVDVEVEKKLSDSEYIENNKKYVANSESIVSIADTEQTIPYKEAKNELVKIFNNIGYVKTELGDVLVNKSSADSIVGHKPTRTKLIAASRIEEILQKGKVIYYDNKNLRGKNYDVAVIAAPITIEGGRYPGEYLVGAQININVDDNIFYLSEVVEIKKDNALPLLHTSSMSGDKNYPSVFSILQDAIGYKYNFTSNTLSEDDFEDVDDSSVGMGTDVAYSIKVEDPQTLDFLNNQDYITTYRSFQLIDGGLYAPMAAMDYEYDEKGKKVKKLGYRSELGQWEQATEAIDVARANFENGKKATDKDTGREYAKFDLEGGDNKTGDVAYNPYLHSSNVVLNDQFAAAYRRNLVVVECRVPKSELTSGYQAELAKDPVGWREWKSGKVAGKIADQKDGFERQVFLSRWMKPVRILSDSEVAGRYKEYLSGTKGITVPWNVVTPSLRKALIDAGVKISYEDVKQGSSITRFEDKFPGERYSLDVETPLDIASNIYDLAFDIDDYGTLDAVNGDPMSEIDAIAADISEGKTERYIDILEDIIYEEDEHSEKAKELLNALNRITDGRRYSLDLDEDEFALFDTDNPSLDNKSILEEGLKALKGKDVDTKAINKIAAQLKNEFASTIDKKEFADMLTRAFGYLHSQDNITFNDVMSIFSEVARPVIDQATKVDNADMYNDFVEFFKGRKIKLTSTQMDEVKAAYGSYSDFQKAMYPLQFSTNGETTLDDMWIGLADYFPGLIEYDTVEGDMPMALNDVLTSIKPSPTNTFGANAEEVGKDLAMRIVEEYFNGQTNVKLKNAATQLKKAQMQYRNDVRAKYNQKLNNYKQKSKDSRNAYTDKLRAAYNERLRYQNKKAKLDKDWALADQRAKYEAKLETEKQNVKDAKAAGRQNVADTRLDFENRIADIKAKSKEKMSTYKDRQNAAAQKKQISKIITDLSNKIMNPTEKKHVPSGMVKPLMDFIQCFNFVDPEIKYDADTKEYKIQMLDFNEMVNGVNHNHMMTLTGKTTTEVLTKFYAALNSGAGSKAQFSWQERMREIERLFNQSTELTGDGGDVVALLDPTMAQDLEDIITRNNYVLSINNLKTEDLVTIKQALKSINHALEEQNKAFTIKAEISDMAHGIQQTAYNLKKKDHTAMYNGLHTMLVMNMMTPETFFSLLGKQGEKMYESLAEAYEKKISFIHKTENFIEDITKKYDVSQKDMRSWREDIKTFDTSEGKMKLTVSQIMSLYELRKRKQAQLHRPGGFVVDKIEEGIIKTIVNQNRGKHLSEDEMDVIVGTLTQSQINIADALQKYMATECAAWGNEASMMMYDYEKFLDPDYFPIKVDSNVTNTKGDDGILEVLNGIERMGFTKAVTKNANNPIVIKDIFDVFVSHTTDMATYASYAPAIKDTLRVLNYKDVSESGDNLDFNPVKTSIDECMGRSDHAGTEYLKKLIGDINGTERSASIKNFGDKLVGNYKAAAVGANARVVVQQPTAYIRAATVINPKYLVEATPKAFVHDMNKLKNDNELIYWKSKGYYETSLGKNVEQILLGSDSIKDKLVDASMWLAGKADDITWACLYDAAERQVRAENPGLTGDDYKNKVNDLFREVIHKTQVVDATLMKSPWQRSRDGKDNLMTAFMAEPIKSYNILMKSMIQAYRKDVPVKVAVYYAGVLLATDMVNALAQAIIDGIRYHDDDDKYYEEVLDYWFKNLADNVNPLNRIPFIKDVFDQLSKIMSGENTYGSTNGQLYEYAAMNSILDAITVTKKLLDGNYNKTGYAAYMTYAKAFSQLFGIPAYAFSRDAISAWNFVAPDNMDMLKSAKKDSDLYKPFVEALNEGKSDEYLNNKVSYILGKNGTVKGLEDSIASAYKSDYVEAIENDDAISDEIFELAVRGYMSLGVNREDAESVVEGWTDKKTGYTDLDKAIRNSDGIELATKIVIENKETDKILEHIYNSFSSTIELNRSLGIESDIESNVNKVLNQVAGIDYDTLASDMEAAAQEKAERAELNAKKDEAKTKLFDSINTGQNYQQTTQQALDAGVDVKTALNNEYKDEYIRLVKSGNLEAANSLRNKVATVKAYVDKLKGIKISKTKYGGTDYYQYEIDQIKEKWTD